MAYSLLCKKGLCGKEVKLEVVTITCAICVAGYTAIAIEYVAQNHFGLPLEEIRGTALLIAVVMATVVAIDFFSKKLGKAR